MRAGVLGLALVLALAGPAAARVEDPLGLLGDGVAKSLQTELSNLHADDIDVVVTTSAPAGADVEAAQVFAQRKPGPGGGVVLVAARDQVVGVALGASYADRGVDAARVKKLVDTHMPAAFKEGMPSDGVIALVRDLKMARALGKPRGYVPPPPPPRTPWELLIGGALAIVGGAAWALTRRARRRHRLALEERVRGERGRLAKLREDLRALAERAEAIGADTRDDVARELAGAVVRCAAALDADQDAIRQALRGLAARLEGGKPAGVDGELTAWAARTGVLHMGVATLGVAAAPLAATRADVDAALAAAGKLVPAPADAGELGEARRAAEDGRQVAALAHVARACAAAAPADPDEAWLALMQPPTEGPARASGMVDRWQRLQAACEAAEARDREAGRPARDGLRARLEELQRMLTAKTPDLVRAELLLAATERLQASRQAGAMVVDG